LVSGTEVMIKRDSWAKKDRGTEGGRLRMFQIVRVFRMVPFSGTAIEGNLLTLIQLKGVVLVLQLVLNMVLTF